MSHSVRINIGGRTLSIETGAVAKQADGAAWVRYGDTVVLVAAVAAKEPSTLDFFGSSVVVSGDTALVGARGRDELGPTNGAAYAYVLPRDCNDDAVPDECQAGDPDGNEVIDLPDYAVLYQCLSDPCEHPLCKTPLDIDVCCRIVDFNNDRDVDLEDIAEFQRAFTGH